MLHHYLWWLEIRRVCVFWFRGRENVRVRACTKTLNFPSKCLQAYHPFFLFSLSPPTLFTLPFLTLSSNTCSFGVCLFIYTSLRILFVFGNGEIKSLKYHPGFVQQFMLPLFSFIKTKIAFVKLANLHFSRFGFQLFNFGSWDNCYFLFSRINETSPKIYPQAVANKMFLRIDCYCKSNWSHSEKN